MCGKLQQLFQVIQGRSSLGVSRVVVALERRLTGAGSDDVEDASRSGLRQQKKPGRGLADFWARTRSKVVERGHGVIGD